MQPDQPIQPNQASTLEGASGSVVTSSSEPSAPTLTPPASSSQSPLGGQTGITSPTTAPAWAQYIGHIVRWQDGTSWQVLADGRHWIPDGGTFMALQSKGAQVFNLPAEELDNIPDIKGSRAVA